MALELFLADGTLHRPTINEVLRALEAEGVRVVPLAKNSSPSTGTATASLHHDKPGDAV
jgi:hypothetical protein